MNAKKVKAIRKAVRAGLLPRAPYQARMAYRPVLDGNGDQVLQAAINPKCQKSRVKAIKKDIRDQERRR